MSSSLLLSRRRPCVCARARANVLHTFSYTHTLPPFANYASAAALVRTIAPLLLLTRPRGNKKERRIFLPTATLLSLPSLPPSSRHRTLTRKRRKQVRQLSNNARRQNVLHSFDRGRDTLLIIAIREGDAAARSIIGRATNKRMGNNRNRRNGNSC